MDLETKKAAFLDEVRAEVGEEAAEVASRVFGWAADHDLRDYFAEPNVHGEQYWPVVKSIEWEPAPIVMSSKWGQVSLSGEELYRHSPFSVSTKKSSLIDRLYAIPEVVRTEKDTYPHVSLIALADATTWNGFFDVVQWATEEIRRAASRGTR